MTGPTTATPAPFRVDIPEGWKGIERPRPDVAFEIVPDDAVGFESRLAFEAYPALPEGDGETPPLVTLIADRVEGLRETMTDALFLDLTRHEHGRGSSAVTGLVATVAYRHGPHLVTALLWALPVDDGALLITGLTTADLIHVDAPGFSAIVASVRFGSGGDPEVEAAVEAARSATVVVQSDDDADTAVGLPATPDGWIEEFDRDPRLLRRLVRARGEVPVVISVLRGLEVEGDAFGHHVAALADLDASMTDPDFQHSGEDPIAAGAMHRGVVAFRQGRGDRVADLWAGDPRSDLPVIVVISDLDDADGRSQAVEWVRTASREELGLA